MFDRDFKNWLVDKGYKEYTPSGNPSTAYDYVKRINFVIEQAKIKCARKLFNELSTSKVRYHDVTSYEDLLNVMKSIN